MAKVGPFTIRQLDAGCAVRMRQDWIPEGEGQPGPDYDVLSALEKKQCRLDLLAILKAMR
jgi:hypothetical protein